MTVDDAPRRPLAAQPSPDDALREHLQHEAASTDGKSPDRAVRAARFARLLAEAASEQHASRTAPPPERHRAPLPAGLAELIAAGAELSQIPDQLVEAGIDGGTVFNLPGWLTRADASGTTDSIPGLLSVAFRRGGREIVVRADPAGTVPPDAALRAVKLRRKAPSKHRRRRIVETASSLLAELGTVLGRAAPTPPRLQNMLDDPATAETAGLRVWNDFVASCRVPPSFRVRNRSLSLADLLVLRRGSQDGRHREAFADHFPWAARHELDGGDPEEVFSTIDDNPADSIVVAARNFCCTGDAACDKAIRFAKLLPRHRLKQPLDRLLGAPADPADKQVRSLLLEAHSQDSELLTHIGRDVPRTRAQIRRALDVFFAYRDGTMGSFPCAYALATLLVRMMVRNASDPEEIDPDLVAAGLAAVSADSLAAFASARLDDPSTTLPEPDADILDTGALALLSYVGEPGRPRLTVKQLVRFARAAHDLSGHRIEIARTRLVGSAPPPPGWSDAKHSDAGGVRIRPLGSFGEMAREGREMRNCLREGRYQLASLLGRLSLFAIGADDQRATLALRPTAERAPGGGVRYTGWEIDQLRGPLNADPAPACEQAAVRLVELLDQECPRLLSQEEVQRQRTAREALDQSRSFNRNILEAQARWEAVYRDHLPPSFGTVSPDEIVANYLARSLP